MVRYDRRADRRHDGREDADDTVFNHASLPRLRSGDFGGKLSHAYSIAGAQGRFSFLNKTPMIDTVLCDAQPGCGGRDFE